MGTKRSVQMAAIGLVGLLLVAVLAAPAAAQKLDVMKMGLMRILALTPIYSGLDNGYFKEQGIDLQIKAMRGGAVILPAISGGSIDIGFSNLISLFIAREQGFDYVAVDGISYEKPSQRPGTRLGYQGTSALMVRGDSPIKSVKDLEGKNVAINTRRNIVWLTISELMAQRGADPSKVRWVELPFPRMGAPLKTGQVDAIFQVQPLVPIYQQKFKFRILDYPYAGITKKTFPLSFFISREKWVKKNGDLLKRFRKANRKGIERINSDIKERNRVVIAHLRMKPGLIDKVYWNYWSANMDVETTQWLADLSLKWKLLKKKQDVRTLMRR